MAETIGRALPGFDSREFLLPRKGYDIVWTGEDLMTLELKKNDSSSEVSDICASEIIDKFYRIKVTCGYAGTVSPHAAYTLRAIERAVIAGRELIFVTSPNDLGVKWMETIKAFFKPTVPCCHIALQKFNYEEVKKVLDDKAPTTPLQQYMIDNAMRSILKRDLSMRWFDYEPIATEAIRLLKNIATHGQTIYPYENPEEPRSYSIGDILTFDDLAAVLWSKFGIFPSNLRPAVQSLYEKGMISNPITMSSYNLLPVSSITPLGEIESVDIHKKIDREKIFDDDELIEDVVYTFIVGHYRWTQEGKDVSITYPSYNENPNKPIMEYVVESQMACHRRIGDPLNPFVTVTAHLDRLIELGFIRDDDKCVAITDHGREFLENYKPE